jgi:uncharacterized delta-60 repeat protein
MKKNLPYYFAFFFCLISSAAIAQQPVEEWARRYNGIGSQNDNTASMAVDAAGNTYVLGSTRASYYSSNFPPFIVVKYAPTGRKLWEKSYETNYALVANAIAVDNAGGVYVTGGITSSVSRYDYLTVRFDAATGEVDWAETYNGASDGSDQATHIVVDNIGGVYVTGSSSTNGPNGNTGDFVTIRYEAMTGERTWVSSYDGYNGGHDVPAALTVDNNGSVYVTGYSDGGGVLPTNATIAYNAVDGSERWSMRGDGAKDIAVDNLGGVYVTGTKFNPISKNNFSTVRYDAATGALTWETPFNGGYNGNDQAVAIATDNEGGIYVVGHSEIAGNSYDLVTIRYNAATGASTWIQTYDGGYDQASGIVADNQGSVFITGASIRNGHFDFVTVGYVAASGRQIWDMRYDGPAHGRDYSYHIAADGLGGLYVSGSSVGIGTRSDITTIRYVAATGSESWVNRLDIKGPLADQAIAIATDAEGNSYVSGNSTYHLDFISRINSFTTIKYSPTGEELWVKEFYAGEDILARGNIVRAIAVDNEGGVYITGSSYRNSNEKDFVTIRYDATTGHEDWVQYYNGPANGHDAPTALVVGQGGVFVTGYSLGYLTPNLVELNDYATIRYDAATGNEEWVMRYDRALGGHAVPTGIALNNQGELFVTGYSLTGSTGNDYLTISYNAANGAERWVRAYNTSGNFDDIARSIAVDNLGGVYVTGHVDNHDSDNPIRDIVTIRYNTENGNPDWIQQYNGPGNSNDAATAIAVDNIGGVFVTGYSYGNNNSSSRDFVTVRYDAVTGDERWVQRYDGPGKSFDDARAIAVDNQGGVYVTGFSYGEDFNTSVFSTVKYAATDGTQIWEIHSAGPRDGAMDMALDADNNIIVTGYSFNTQTDYDFLTIKYSQSGTCAPLAQAAIQGSTTAAMDARGVVYSINAPGATAFEWRITDDHGEPYYGFTGQGTGTISVNWPAAPHAFKVSVSYGSGPACPTLLAVTYVHVYEVAAGFVTGGGWLQSPVSMAHEFMHLPGKAHFELMAKYRKGEQHLLQGETQLRLENGHLVFRSTALEARSLVINQNHAFYRGHGKVSYRNDQGQLELDPRSFTFLVSATDGAQGPGKGKGTDFLRILVWELNADGSRGAVVYDNQTGFGGANLDENAHAVQPINGGNIVIHSPYLAQSNKHNALAGEGMPGRDGLQAYPTSFSDRTTLAFALEEDAAYSLDLYDMMGALVKQISAGEAKGGRRYEHELEAGVMAKGLYLVRLTAGNSSHTVKVILQR